MVFPPLGNSDHVVVSVSIDFPINSKQDTLFHCVAYDYSHTNWDGLRDYLRDVPWGISLNSVLLLLLVNFVNGFRLELMYISLIASIRSSYTHLHGFQLLILKEAITSQKLGSQDFWQIDNSVLKIGKSAIPPLFNSPEVLSSASSATAS